MAKKEIKGKFKPSTTAERQFYKSLRKVAQVSGHIVESHVHGVNIENESEMHKALNNYARLIEPWARRQSAKLLETVQRSNKRAYDKKSKALGIELKNQLKGSEYVGALARALLNEQVALITSIPIEAGQRAQNLAFKAAIEGRRAVPDQSTIDEIQKQLGSSTEVAVSRAQLIAVTETARANAAINQSRAQSVGSTHYRWHNSADGAVRDSHKTYKGKPMQGRQFAWDDPPTLSDGMTGHPGTFPRCRCFAEPIFDEE